MKTLVIGVGNEHRGDDAAGLEVARALAARKLPGVEVRESSGDTFALMELWMGAEWVLLVDAVCSGGGAGEVHRFDAAAGPLPVSFVQPCSTHGLGLAETIEMARSLDRLPPTMIVCGIEAAGFAPGHGMTPAVADAVPGLVEAIGMEIESRGRSARH